jgi:threonine dehydratase
LTTEVPTEVPYEEILRARSVVSELARPTQVLESLRLSELLGGRIVLKAENLQRTGSFKLRGALNKVASLEPGIRGVVTGSAGNHGQSLAFAARARGLDATVFMPERASLGKIAAAQESGAEVIVGGDSVHACISEAQERAEAEDIEFVHPYNDPLIVAGQGTLGVEITQEVADISRVLAPVGGGGLAAGVATAIKETLPHAEVIGVQAEACAPLPESLKEGRPVGVAGGSTLADGIAVKQPGSLTLPILERLLDGVAVVDEDAIAEAIVVLLERAKLVVEGAGAVGIAALMSGAVAPGTSGTTVVILSGGNIDPGVLADVARRHETATGRRLRLFTTIADEPGSLATLLTCLGDAGANLIDVMHVREGVGLGVGETGVELVMETRGTDHAQELLRLLDENGYSVRVLS